MSCVDPEESGSGETGSETGTDAGSGATAGTGEGPGSGTGDGPAGDGDGDGDGEGDGDGDGDGDGEPPLEKCTTWEPVQGLPGVDWYDIAWLDADRAIAVGLAGTAIRSEDGGESWDALEVGTNDDLRSVDFAPAPDADHGWIFGGAGVDSYVSAPTTIRHSTDGGDTWSAQSTGIFFPPTRVHAMSSQRAMAVWALGDLHPDGHWNRTTDGGANWGPGGVGQDFVRPFRALMDVQFVGDMGWTVGANLYADVSINGQPSSSPLANELGGIVHSKDGGATWELQQTGVPEGTYFNGVYFTDAQHGWVVDQLGDILATQDSGQSWVPQSSGVSSALRGVWFTDAETGWAVGDGGVIVHTEDGGGKWMAQASGTTSVLRRVTAVPGRNPWAVGDDGVVLRCK